MLLDLPYSSKAAETWLSCPSRRSIRYGPFARAEVCLLKCFSQSKPVSLSVYPFVVGLCWELGTANQSDRLGDHVIRGRNDLSA